MAGVGWHFPIHTGGGEEGYTSNDIEAFKGEDLYVNLARETCQNSLDAKTAESNGPVIVKYTIREFPVDSYPFFTAYKAHVARCRQYWESREDDIPERLDQLLQEISRTLDRKTVTALLISDYNTPGLLGSATLSGSFNALVYADGISYKQSDTSAGSFGIGHNAPFACSSLSCVCYNTKAVDGGEAFAGIAKLATAYNSDDGTTRKKTRKNGRYQFNDDEHEVWRPIRPEDGDKFAQAFTRTEYGTDVIILGFDNSDNWHEQLKIAVMKNFFLAIDERKLVVEIEDEVIDADTIADMLADEAEKNRRDKELVLTQQLHKTIRESKKIPIRILDESENSDATLQIRTDPEIGTLKGVAWFRDSGMLIRHYRPVGIFRPYVAVFVASDSLDRLLRDTEPARHNDWDYKRLGKNTPERTKARRAINKIKSEIKSRLSEECESIVDKQIDAAGAANYLPDNLGGGAQEGGGSDILRPLVKISGVKKQKQPKQTEKIKGRKGRGGKKVPGAVGNHTRNPNPDPTAKPLDPVGGTGNTPGVRPGPGGKTIERLVKGTMRAFALVASNGIYRLVIIPSESSSQVYARCSSVGENGNKDSLRVKKAMMQGRQLQVSNDFEIGPFEVSSGERAEIIITFEERANMALEISLTTKGTRK